MLLKTISYFFILIIVWEYSLQSNPYIIAASLPLWFFIKSPFPIKQNTIYFIISVAFLTLFFLIMNIFHEHISYQKLHDSYIFKIIYINYIVILLLLFYSDKIDLLQKSINFALFVCIIVFYFQTIVYYTTGTYIDFLEPITGVSQRYQMYFSAADLIRPTSLFNEPGSYAAGTLPLLILSYLTEKKLTKLHIFTLLSYYLSFSFFAIIEATLFIFTVVMLKYDFKLSLKNISIIFLLFSMLSIVTIGLNDYIKLRTDPSKKQVAGISQRSHILKYWLSLDSKNILWGQGFAQTKFKSYVTEDNGLAFKLIFEYGITSFPMFAFIFFISWGQALFFTFILLLTKLTYLTYDFWFYLVSLYLLKPYFRKKNNK